MIIGLVGHKGVGKNTVASILDGRTKIALADPLKHICREVFGWPAILLWGPSEDHDAPDPQGRLRPDGQPLTPRFALQRLGTEFGRACYPNVWVDKVLHEAQEVIDTARDEEDLADWTVVIPDVRFVNEARAIVDAGGILWRIFRAGYTGDGCASETEMDSDEMSAMISATIVNDYDLETLRVGVQAAYEKARTR